MTYEQLEKLAQNPNYKLSPAQLAELEAHRQIHGTRNVRHSTTVVKHEIQPPRHSTDLEEEDDDPTNRG